MSEGEGRGEPLTALGLMSGTSMDGIDVALLRTDGHDLVERGPFLSVPYPASLRRRIEAALEVAAEIEDRTARPDPLAALEQELTDRHAAAVEQFLAMHDRKTASIDLVGAHGQTVVHRPERGLTVQLLDAGRLARALGLRIVADIRQGDVELGGQGAPLVPVYLRALAKTLAVDAPLAFVNVGGISNVTYVDGETLIAFDCGPGNALLDQWVSRMAGVPFDQDGRIASEGAVERGFVANALRSSFFSAPPPKSLDRNDFKVPDSWAIDLADGARTLTRLTAEAIAASKEHLPVEPRTWVVSGGGARNSTLMGELRDVLGPADVRTADAYGLDGDALEAEAWAYLAVRVARGLPISEPTTTGRRALGAADRAKFGGWL